MWEQRLLQKKKTKLPVAGGMLAVIAACAAAVNGVLCLDVFVLSFEHSPIGRYMQPYEYLLTGSLSMHVFVFGLVSGIMTLKRKNFALSIFGLCVAIVGSSIIILGVPKSWIITHAHLILSSFSLILVALSKREFA